MGIITQSCTALGFVEAEAIQDSFQFEVILPYAVLASRTPWQEIEASFSQRTQLGHALSQPLSSLNLARDTMICTVQTLEFTKAARS